MRSHADLCLVSAASRDRPSSTVGVAGPPVPRRSRRGVEIRMTDAGSETDLISTTVHGLEGTVRLSLRERLGMRGLQRHSAAETARSFGSP